MLAVTVSVVFAAAWYLFDYGRWKAGFDSTEAARQVQAYRDRVVELEALRDDLQREVTRLESSAKVDQQANELVRTNVRTAQARMQSTREELAFLRSIISPEDAGAALRVHELSLTAGVDSSEFGYQVTVIQVLGKKTVKGRVEIFVDGLSGQQPEHLTLAELDPNIKKGHAVELRSFQRISGRLRLPEGFEPQSITVALIPARKGADRVSLTKSWREALKPSPYAAD